MTYPALVFQGEIPTSDSLNKALNDLQTQINTLNASGTGSVTTVSVVTANGMSGTVATPTTTPAITLVVGAINLAAATGLSEAGLSLTDITTNNVSITKHGFAPKGPNDATKYLDGTGAYSVPAGSGGSITIGTTTITGGTTTRLLYDAAGVVGEITGATSNGTALTLVAPVLGTPASGTLTNCTGLPAAGVVGTAAILGANTFTGVQTFASAANGGITGASNILAMVNSTNIQQFRVYGSFTDASNGQWVEIAQNSNSLSNNFVWFATNANGTGTNKGVGIAAASGTGAQLTCGTNGAFNFDTASRVGWQLSSTGHLLASTDNTFDIGASGATRPRNLYVGTDVFTNDATFLIRAKTTLTTGAGAGAGTLTNAPASGNPTKWIGIDDNGTTRFIPAW